MSIPIEGVGVGVISGGTAVALAIKLLPILLRKFNGRNRGNRNNPKPGTAKVCIDRGEKIVQHDEAIKHLCGSIVRIDKQMETAHKEDREDHQQLLVKLDEIGK